MEIAHYTETPLIIGVCGDKSIWPRVFLHKKLHAPDESPEYIVHHEDKTMDLQLFSGYANEEFISLAKLVNGHYKIIGEIDAINFNHKIWNYTNQGGCNRAIEEIEKTARKSLRWRYPWMFLMEILHGAPLNGIWREWKDDSAQFTPIKVEQRIVDLLIDIRTALTRRDMRQANGGD